MVDRYNFSLTTFSPSGKLGQIEYALNAVMQGEMSVGIKALNGAVLVSEKKSPSPLIDNATIEKVAEVCPNLGIVYSGMGPDARILTIKARKAAQVYKMTYGEYPSALALVKELATIMQDFTQSGGVRPFGVSLLVIGKGGKQGEAALYQVDPSGAYWPWRASAIGRGMNNAKSFLEKRYADDLELEDAVHLALLSLKESFEGAMTLSNIEIGVVSAIDGCFTKLASSQISEYLMNI